MNEEQEKRICAERLKLATFLRKLEKKLPWESKTRKEARDLHEMIIGCMLPDKVEISEELGVL